MLWFSGDHTDRIWGIQYIHSFSTIFKKDKMKQAQSTIDDWTMKRSRHESNVMWPLILTRTVYMTLDVYVLIVCVSSIKENNEFNTIFWILWFVLNVMSSMCLSPAVLLLQNDEKQSYDTTCETKLATHDQMK